MTLHAKDKMMTPDETTPEVEELEMARVPITRFALFLATLALCLGCVWLSVRPVAGQAASQSTLSGAAAIERLTIDPLFTLQQRLLAGDGAAGDHLGYAVALDGNTALVGAPYDDENGMEQGSAYVFVRSFTPSGATWTQQARLVAQDRSSFDYFGYAVALDGDTALVGAVYGPGSVNPEQGAVYVFVRGGNGTWTQQARLNAGDGQSQDQFGAAVALDGDTALVGAFNHQVSSTSGKTGAAYVFVRNGASWTQQARLSANDGAADDRFGFSVALDGDTALVGAPGNTISVSKQGAAYIFTRSGASWAQQQRLGLSQPAVDDHFGNAVALGGDKALVGAYLWGGDDSGKVFTFVRGAAGWTQPDSFTAPNPAAGAHFGVSVAMNGDTAVVGASLGLSAMGVDHRSAYVFSYDGGDWEPVRRLGPELGSANDGFGHAVALDGDTVLIGAYRSDAAAADQGAAYAFVSPPCPPITLTPDSLPNGAIGAAYHQQLTGSGGSGEGDYLFAVSRGALPPGLTLVHSAGVLSGTPTTAGTYRFTITATFGLSLCSGSREYTLTVRPTCPTLTLNPATLPDGGIDTPYNLPLTVAGGKAPYSFRVTAGALPGGLSLSNAGALAGTPTASGSFNFTAAATDANGCQGARAYTMVVHGCFYTIAPNPQSFSAMAQTGNVTVGTTASCAWTAQSNNSWIKLSDSGGRGSGTVRFTVAANSGAERTGTITIAGQTATVIQAALPSGTPRLVRLTPNAARAGTNGLILDVIGSSFTASQRVQWNGVNYETNFVSATQLRVAIPAAELAREGTAFAQVIDTANGARSNLGKFRILGAVAHASAASFNPATLAPDSVVAAFGADLATEVRVAESLPLPTELAGTTVTVRDSQGASVQAPLFFVAPNQVNYLMPPGLAEGVATVTITNGRGVTINNMTEISAVAPGLFSANASGEGAAVGVVLRISANGEQVYEPVARYDAQTQKFTLLPIDLSNAADQVYLILFGTGIRHHGELEDVAIRLGETELPVAYAGAAPGLAGVDQVNVLLPASLRGRGEQTVALRVNDEVSNGVNVRFQ